MAPATDAASQLPDRANGNKDTASTLHRRGAPGSVRGTPRDSSPASRKVAIQPAGSPAAWGQGWARP